ETAASLIQLQVKSAAQALAVIAANRYGRPADVLTLVGITGTNGKTTTNFLVEALLQEAGLVPGLLGTITYRYRGRSYPAPFTTPTALLLHRILAEMGEQGVRAVTLETSSHALALGRLHGVRFRVAAFTNLTQDHLDFHHTMEEYYAAKASLFHEHLLPPELGGMAVLNIDDSYGRRLAAELPAARRLTVSIDGPADISVLTERISIDGIAATLRTPIGEVALSCGMTGRFNLANLAVATGIGVALGLPASLIGRGLSQVSGVAGRLERVASPRGGRGPSIFVDYAHTPDALARALAALKPLTTPPLTTTSPTGRRGRLIVVFGCGGARDAGKRPQMGQVAARDADVVVVTSDNPRTENPQAIIDSIVAGLLLPVTAAGSAPAGPPPRLERQALATAGQGYYVEPDRRQAITAAVLGARADDVVLIAGKGHEDYQIVGTTKHRFDDREEVQRALAQRDTPSTRSGSAPVVGATATLAATIELPVERIVAATQGKLLRSGPHKFSAVTIDSRLVIPGSLFVAVRGERHDGHSFIGQALAAGATGILVERDKPLPELAAGVTVAVIEVPDTLVALGQLARAHRDAPEIASRLRVVAVTGSSGKTTTKDLIAAILTAHASDPSEVLKTDGNLNNHIGVPLTLLRLRPGQRYAVVEMGMSARGEIAYLTSLARPDVGVITNIGPAHLESLGSLENVALAKGELFSGLLDGAAVVYLGGASAEGGPLAAERLQGPERDRASLQLEVHKQAVRAGAASGRLRSFCAQAGPGAGAAAEGTVVQVAVQAEGEDGLQLALRFPTLAAAGEPLP
ncbi:MAG TPA: UDP-N-acetylmuramoyl-L-alanyl-D-glutamate--2,6-diaminopimelate ligase, partial [Pseudomonadota bacterium]|nr:UDP-N-acetylmuramoyl-L-alanyl-D-glutamate--2,6-diaminopimelate ligase [Pseudomonadota bacterium]